MALQLSRYDDFHLHGASAPEWNQRYQQLTPGVMRSALTEAVAGGVHVFHKWMSEHVVQQGALPADLICFAWVDGPPDRGTLRMQGHELDADSLLILRGGEAFALQRPGGLRLLAATMRHEDLRRLLDARPWSASARALLAQTAVRVPAHGLQTLRRELLATMDLGAPAAPADAAAPARALFEALGGLFADASEQRPRLGSASASHVVAECHRLVAIHAHAPPDVDELCRRLRVSRRSLQYSFRQVAGTTPVHYLRSVRLNAVRHRLLSVPQTVLSVSQAATDQGFEQLSHFGRRYRSLFGELPSRTRRPAAA